MKRAYRSLPFACAHCDDAFEHIWDLRKHLERTHGYASRPTPEEIEEEGYYYFDQTEYLQ